MSISIVGNHSKGFLGNGVGGNGVQNIPAAGMGWVAATGSAANDTCVIALSDILASNINQGIFFQSEAAASVQFTLCSPALAKNKDPNNQASVLWGNALSLTADVITKAPVLFTACKITFTAPGTVYIGVR